MPVWSIFYALSGYNNHLSQKKLFCLIKIQLIFVTTLIVWILILCNICSSPSCPEGFKVSSYNLNHVIWFSFEQDTIQKPLFSYFLQGWVQHISILALFWSWLSEKTVDLPLFAFLLLESLPTDIQCLEYYALPSKQL